MVKSLCRLLIYVNHALVANFNVANMSFNAIRENKILAKISEFTVFDETLIELSDTDFGFKRIFILIKHLKY